MPLFSLYMTTPPRTLFLAKLTDALQRREPKALEEEGARHAAVAVVVTQEQDAALLFVKRRERSGDPWSGHIAFPGGHAEPGESPSTTAERETLEETGLALGRVGRLLGRLDDVYPRSVYLPKIIVTPVVYAVPSRLEVRPSEEIERAVWVEAGDVFDPANRKPFELRRPSGKFDFESIHVAGLVIWGLTERILGQIATAIESGP
jgi:8-oxo-dGTP pyrophosphatase MutT (NUDIX family)